MEAQTPVPQPPVRGGRVDLQPRAGLTCRSRLCSGSWRSRPRPKGGAGSAVTGGRAQGSPPGGVQAPPDPHGHGLGLAPPLPAWESTQPKGHSENPTGRWTVQQPLECSSATKRRRHTHARTCARTHGWTPKTSVKGASRRAARMTRVPEMPGQASPGHPGWGGGAGAGRGDCAGCRAACGAGRLANWAQGLAARPSASGTGLPLSVVPLPCECHLQEEALEKPSSEEQGSGPRTGLAKRPRPPRHAKRILGAPGATSCQAQLLQGRAASSEVSRKNASLRPARRPISFHVTPDAYHSGRGPKATRGTGRGPGSLSPPLAVGHAVA